MIDVAILERIRALREKYKDEHPDALKQIDEWAAELSHISELEEFAGLAVTQAIAGTLKGRIKDIMRERATKQGHTPETLNTLDEREKEIRYLLSLFMPQYESQLTSLTQLIDAELE